MSSEGVRAGCPLLHKSAYDVATVKLVPIGLHIQQSFVEVDVGDLVDVKAAANKGFVATLP